MMTKLPGFHTMVQIMPTCKAFRYTQVATLLTKDELKTLQLLLIKDKILSYKGDSYIPEDIWKQFIEITGIAVLKAHGGDRSKNLESIADTIDKILEVNEVYASPEGNIRLDPSEIRKIKGYMEQLRIIAQEIKS